MVIQILYLIMMITPPCWTNDVFDLAVAELRPRDVARRCLFLPMWGNEYDPVRLRDICVANHGVVETGSWGGGVDIKFQERCPVLFCLASVIQVLAPIHTDRAVSLEYLLSISLVASTYCQKNQKS